MKWEPTPYPDMSQAEYDDLAHQMRAAGGWPEGMPSIVVDDEGNLIDGFKRHRVMTDLGYSTAPAIVIQSDSVPEGERAAKYAELRKNLNNQSLLVDEIENWLKEIR
jgi:hypothetical protein